MHSKRLLYALKIDMFGRFSKTTAKMPVSELELTMRLTTHTIETLLTALAQGGLMKVFVAYFAFMMSEG